MTQQYKLKKNEIKNIITNLLTFEKSIAEQRVKKRSIRSLKDVDTNRKLKSSSTERYEKTHGNRTSSCGRLEMISISKQINFLHANSLP